MRPEKKRETEMDIESEEAVSINNQDRQQTTNRPFKTRPIYLKIACCFFVVFFPLLGLIFKDLKYTHMSWFLNQRYKDL